MPKVHLLSKLNVSLLDRGMLGGFFYLGTVASRLEEWQQCPNCSKAWNTTGFIKNLFPQLFGLRMCLSLCAVAFFGSLGILLCDRVNQVTLFQGKLPDGHRSQGFMWPAPCQRHNITGKQKIATWLLYILDMLWHIPSVQHDNCCRVSCVHSCLVLWALMMAQLPGITRARTTGISSDS